jgi:hypothetical protein
MVDFQVGKWFGGFLPLTFLLVPTTLSTFPYLLIPKIKAEGRSKSVSQPNIRFYLEG